MSRSFRRVLRNWCSQFEKRMPWCRTVSRGCRIRNQMENSRWPLRTSPTFASSKRISGAQMQYPKRPMDVGTGWNMRFRGQSEVKRCQAPVESAQTTYLEFSQKFRESIPLKPQPYPPPSPSYTPFDGVLSMALFSFQLLLSLLSLLVLGHAHNIQMRAHSRECFHETLHKDDKMTVTFQVGDREFGGSGNLDIDFWVCTAQMFTGFQENGRVTTMSSPSPGLASIGSIWKLEMHILIGVCTTDPTTLWWLPGPPNLCLVWRPLLRSTHRRQIHVLFQQRALVCQHERGQLQCAWYSIRARERGAIGPVREGRYEKS